MNYAAGSGAKITKVNVQLPSADRNLEIYNGPVVVDHYVRLEYLSACEQILFESFLKRGMSILDIGVGGGRTTAFLSGLASRYVGIDYALAMVSACRQKFPDREFQVAHAADLRKFESESFDAVVLAFNTIDYIIPDDKRAEALAEMHRVMKPGGLLIFSSHNPRAILNRPTWNASRLDQMAHRLAHNAGLSKRVAKAVVFAGCWPAAMARSVVISGRRVVARLTKKAFWRGEGYMTDPAHGGLLTHYAIPEKVTADLTRAGFCLLRLQGDDYPLPSRMYFTDWYYYVATTVPS
jgi:ubiquinone/menaquinone biosynthesis C-methylase UbiE